MKAKRRKLVYSDPLDETVGADDITGRNNCPVWQRISAIGCYEPAQRVSIMNGSRNSDTPMGRGRGYKAVRCWAIIQGELVEKDQIGLLGPLLGVRGNTLQKHRTAAIFIGKGETVTNRIRWGWYES